jgi:hypothetical protein
MMQLRVWLTRLIGTFGRRRCDRELASELDGHLQCHRRLAAASRASRIDPAEALRES